MRKKIMENWKTKALKKQLAHKQKLGLTASGIWGNANKKYPHILSDKDAKNGTNFYCHNNPDEWELLQKWAENSKGKKVNFIGLGLKNMLRSEHIPYNLFYPLERLRTENPKLLSSFLEELFDNNIQVDKVTTIKIEFDSKHLKSKLLNDNTSFDAYIEYKDGNDTCGLGIEVKYTEKSYPYGKTEKTRMFDPASEYNLLSKRSGYYLEEKLHELREKLLKQPWRNHLLGIKLVEAKQLDRFTSVHIYPNGNKYQGKACDEYKKCLTDDAKNSFAPITFEKFVEVGEKVFTKPKYKNWIDYLKERY